MNYNGMPEELANLYKDLPARDLFYIKARWMVNPLEIVESIIPQNGRIYDLGCGLGLLSNLIALKSPRRSVTGIDVSEKKINIAKKTVRNRTNINFELADINIFSILDADVITMCDVLHHVSFAKQIVFFERVYKTIKKNGILIIQDIDRRPFCLKYLFPLAVDKIMNKMERTYYAQKGMIKSYLEKLGFAVEMRDISKGYPIAAVLFKCVKKGE